ncbi:MAG: hypothetical protein MUQ65_13540, partial [Armatimonadetes bacterium]|nr:hypothetical protein [Armatimonadota bacterium]
ALGAAEVVESAQDDRSEHFLSDGQFRGAVFTGIKWRAGWVLLLGDDQEPYARAFDEASFMVFVTRQGVDVGRSLGERDTASVYFAQLLARYALLYSDVKAGERHELTHFVEDHGPGVLVVCGEMKPVEALLCLALMRLGVGAVVAADDFPWEVGNRVEVASPEAAVGAAGGFQNMRIRSQEDPLSALPDYANPAYVREEFESACTLGGTPESFLLVRFADVSEGVTTEEDAACMGEDAHGIGFMVGIADRSLDAPAAQELERAAAGHLNLPRGVRVESRDPLTVSLAEAGGTTHQQMADIVRRGLRLEYPRLGPIHVDVIADQKRLLAMADEVKRERVSRREELARLQEADEEVIFSCESCAPFSREHVCLTHPLRSPMCGRRWSEMVVGARYMGVSAGRPWRRRGRPENCCAVVPLGRVIDPEKGEYEGLNEFVRQATDGRMHRVFLHSVRDFPHSSCGCFGALAWWSEEMGGIGIMPRGFKGAAPDGSTWNMLANRAGGKQQPGITGVSLEYMRSPKFLQGDGGWAAVKWMARKLKDELSGDIAAVAGVPTEER